MEIIIAIAVAGCLAVLCFVLGLRLIRYRAENNSLRVTYAPIADIEEEVSRQKEVQNALRQEIASRRTQWDEELQRTLPEIEALSGQVDSLRDSVEIQSFGLYEPQFDFDTSERYKDEIRENLERQKEMIRDKSAAACFAEWVVEGSRVKGRQMEQKQLKLMLRAFNGECDAAIAKTRFDNVQKVEARIQKSFEAVNKLGETNKCRVSDQYLAIKNTELRLNYEYAQKKQREKEEQAQIREQMREEERARKEIEKAQVDAEKEEARFEKALAEARAEMEKVQDSKRDALLKKIALLEEQFETAHDRKAKAISRAQLTKSGHVYVISNLGSFGGDVFKIGMTRRLEPLDRVKELGDASVPFPFDVHAIIYSEDAPGLEGKLHARFLDQQVNLVNHRKEFFNLDLERIQEAVAALAPDVDFIRTAVAEEYRESLAIRRQREMAQERRDEELQAVEVAAAKSKIESLRESWRAEPVG
ncbi:MAG: DUF4041 domain-containing protein [Pseudomonadota bacterium]